MFGYCKLLFFYIFSKVADLTISLKIKRCGEMARKLRFFKDQISKAGLSVPVSLETQVDINLDDLEVQQIVIVDQTILVLV